VPPSGFDLDPAASSTPPLPPVLTAHAHPGLGRLPRRRAVRPGVRSGCGRRRRRRRRLLLIVIAIVAAPPLVAAPPATSVTIAVAVAAPASLALSLPTAPTACGRCWRRAASAAAQTGVRLLKLLDKILDPRRQLSLPTPGWRRCSSGGRRRGGWLLSAAHAAPRPLSHAPGAHAARLLHSATQAATPLLADAASARSEHRRSAGRRGARRAQRRAADRHPPRRHTWRQHWRSWRR
jgi:hypothetical protein